MFVNNPLSSKSEQVSEQVFQPIRVPVIIGNDVYIVTQQDVRNIIETRHISCFKCPNGLRDLQDFFVHSNPTQPQQNNSQQNSGNSFQNISQYLDTINNATNLVQCHCSQNGARYLST
ncbi:unnamed protein product [Hermetia illucens]|uniref:Uncharacterized protein n=1 Tax=Hermetia illucens TaxID=343691 RepID=A0A7R8Z370_HERIL|nr:unnamed protein product [Hermetia illucens]